MATLKERELEQARRNMRPHAEARLAMAMWGREYAYEQSGGSMDFWDALGERRQRLCQQIVDGILRANTEFGRAPIRAEERK